MASMKSENCAWVIGSSLTRGIMGPNTESAVVTNQLPIAHFNQARFGMHLRAAIQRIAKALVEASGPRIRLKHPQGNAAMALLAEPFLGDAKEGASKAPPPLSGNDVHRRNLANGRVGLIAGFADMRITDDV